VKKVTDGWWIGGDKAGGTIRQFGARQDSSTLPYSGTTIQASRHSALKSSVAKHVILDSYRSLSSPAQIWRRLAISVVALAPRGVTVQQRIAISGGLPSRPIGTTHSLTERL